ncbi:MAG: ribbon-helix-helix protein, CopG family [Clostridia bacterium]|nr:ribbon-helix-helix protein, CopG family [Clostridia bacterium]
MATNKIQIGLRLNEPLYEKIRELAAREQRSLNNLIEYVMQKYVEDYEQKNGVMMPAPDDRHE